MTLPIFWQGGNTCSGVADAMNARIQDLGASCSAGFFRPQTNFNSHHHLGSNNCATDAARINTQLGTSISCDQHGNFRWTGGDRHAACVADVQSVSNCLRDESLCAPAPTTSAPTTPAPATPAPTTRAFPTITHAYASPVSPCTNIAIVPLSNVILIPCTCIITRYSRSHATPGAIANHLFLHLLLQLLPL